MHQHTLILSALLALLIGSFVLSWIVVFAMKRIAVRIGFVDKPGHRKIHHNPKPLGGGVGIFIGVALPLLVGLGVVNLAAPIEGIDPAYWSGARQQTPLALALLGAMLIMHVMGLIDDKRALGPFVKLFIQLGVTAALVATFDEVRALTFLGYLPSVILTVLWITAVTNAFNFLDNMDGLSAGVAAVCTLAFLLTAITIEQWFVAATLALLLGALLGFLCFNFPPASIFQGDGGSLVVGFLLGVLTVRTTFLAPGEDFAAGWYAVFAPVIVLALPLYDLIVVSIIRLSRGKSPFVGDTNHFSHRLVARGMSRRTAVLCLYLVTAATSIAAILLPQVQSGFGAILILCQTLLVLGVVALLEQHPLPPGERE
jgi:UDP-GlcNAc:undecaprenyl-phosphate/decaprenyl-phosphate GlcNAc-1-phosphate transferase